MRVNSTAIASKTSLCPDFIAGYQHPFYASAFSEYGRPSQLERTHGWLLVRAIQNTPWFDAMGCYPFFSCLNWDTLAEDIEALKASCVAATIVTDPFGTYTENHLRAGFPDLLMEFKKHYVIDLTKTAESYVCNHHQRNARKALKRVSVENCDRPEQLIDEWLEIYGHIVRRYRLGGILAFSKNSFLQMLQVPGIIVFRAISGTQTVCMQLWYEQGDVAYYHLGASNDLGYECKAAFAMFWTAIHYFTSRGFKWIGLGGGAGLHDKQENGLSRFKSGWANSHRTTYLCGRILNPEVYRRIHQDRGGHKTDYFPAYRQGEF